MENNRYFKTAVILSLFLHTLTAAFLWFKPVEDKNAKEVISLSIVEAPPKPLTAAELKKEKTLPAAKNTREQQIVEQSHKPINDETPTKDYYLSEHNQTVVQQTRAINHGAFENKQLQASPKKPSAQQTAAEKTPAKKSMKSLDDSADGLPTLEALKPKFNWNVAKTKEQKAEGTGKENDASKTDDYLKDVDHGIQTLLSTREFVYYSYYNRIKKQLAQYWEPKIKEKIKRIFAQGRRVASDQDRITRLMIILDNHGTLIGVQVLGESGVTDLDDAAIEAFREAAPFPNPPSGIVEKDGTIKIRWDFVLEA